MNDKKKTPFEPAAIEIIEFGSEDIIRTSGDDEEFDGDEHEMG